MANSSGCPPAANGKCKIQAPYSPPARKKESKYTQGYYSDMKRLVTKTFSKTLELERVKELSSANANAKPGTYITARLYTDPYNGYLH